MNLFTALPLLASFLSAVPCAYADIEGLGYVWKFSDDWTSFQEHQVLAAEWGGMLASLSTQEEADFIEGMGPEKRFLGAIRLQDQENSPSSFEWTDGSPWGYTNWNPAEPNNYENSEDCVERSFADGGAWNDIPCEISRYAIYKKMITDTPTKSPAESFTVSPTKTPTMMTCLDSILPTRTGVTCENIDCAQTGAASHCPLTCDACEEFGCVDSEVPFQAQGKIITCSKFASIPQNKINTYCVITEAFSTCRETCKICM